MAISTDRLLSFSAMFIGLATLFTVVYQTQLQRAAQSASVLPYVTILLTASDGRTYLALRNSGVGPALIEDVVIHYQGRDVETDPFDFYVDLRPDQDAGGLSVDKVIPGRLISAGEVVGMLGWEGAGADEMVPKLLSVFSIGEVPQSWYDAYGLERTAPDKAILEITYTSVYGDRWRVTSDRVVPERI